MINPRDVAFEVGALPPSCLGPDGKFREETEEERKQHRIGAATTAQIAQIPNDPNDPPDEE